MPPEIRKLLTDMLTAAQAIGDFIQGRALTDFAADDQLRSAVYFKFAIIGEALSQLFKLDATLCGSIADAARIVSFRNQVIHGYAGIKDDITWQIIEQKLPVLIRDIESILHNGPNTSDDMQSS